MLYNRYEGHIARRKSNWYNGIRKVYLLYKHILCWRMLFNIIFIDVIFIALNVYYGFRANYYMLGYAWCHSPIWQSVGRKEYIQFRILYDPSTAVMYDS